MSPAPELGETSPTQLVAAPRAVPVPSPPSHIWVVWPKTVVVANMLHKTIRSDRSVSLVFIGCGVLIPIAVAGAWRGIWLVTGAILVVRVFIWLGAVVTGIRFWTVRRSGIYFYCGNRKEYTVPRQPKSSPVLQLLHLEGQPGCGWPTNLTGRYRDRAAPSWGIPHRLTLTAAWRKGRSGAWLILSR